MKYQKTVVPVYKKGYMTLGSRPSRSEYDPSSDAAIRVFDTIHLPVVTIEISGRIFTEIDPCYTRNNPEALLDQVFTRLRVQGFEGNYDKLFTGKFAQCDPVKGLEIEWRHSSHYIQELAEKLAREELMRDSWRDEMGSYSCRDTDRVDFWFWHESWNGYERCLVPKTVKHVESLEVRTSPRILNDWFSKQLEPHIVIK